MKKIWIDYLRVLGIIAVVIVHATSTYYMKFDTIHINTWWFVNIMNSFPRFAVPLFVMISGCVLLGRDLGIKKFYTQRAVRLIPPLVFWSLFYLIFQFAVGDTDLNTFLWQLTIGMFITGKAYYHLWYLSMFICLMVFTPFINKYITGEKPTAEDMFFLFFIFAVFMTLNQISDFGLTIFKINMSWFGTFLWYIVYFIMGYFVDVYSDKIPIGNILGIFVIVLLSIAGTVLNFFLASRLAIVLDSFIFNHTGIINFIRVTLIFYLFAKNRHIFKQNKIVSSIAVTSFGIYLIHPFFLRLFQKYVFFQFEPGIIYISSLIFLVYILSFFSTLMLKKLRWFNSFC